MNHLAFLLLKTLRGLFVKKLQVSIIKQLMLNDELILVNIASKLIQNGIDQTYFFGYVVSGRVSQRDIILPQQPPSITYLNTLQTQDAYVSSVIYFLKKELFSSLLF